MSHKDMHEEQSSSPSETHMKGATMKSTKTTVPAFATADATLVMPSLA